MSGKIHIGRIPTKKYSKLAPDVQRAIIETKNLGSDISKLQVYGNASGGPADGPPLPRLDAGCTYYKKQVGEARQNDSKGKPGTRRLVFEVQEGGRIKNIYYTEYHYAKFSFVRID